MFSWIKTILSLARIHEAPSPKQHSSAGKASTFFYSGWILNSRWLVEFFGQWYIYKRYKTLIELPEALDGARRIAALQLSELI